MTERTPDMVVAVLDTSVLVPSALRDTLLDLAVAGLYAPRWSSDIVEELQRSLIQDRGVGEWQVLDLASAMADEFPEAAVTGYQSLIADLRNHPKDRHVLAAAIHARAEVIVTGNLRHFPAHVLAPFGIAAQSPDDFLSLLFKEAPAEVERVVREQAASYRRPPMSVDQLLERLRQHSPRFVERIATHLMEEMH